MKSLEMYEGTSLKSVAARLELTRSVYGLNQADFARKAKLATTAYNMFETGKRIPTLKAALKLCETFDLSLDWIYRGDPSNLPYNLGDAIKTLKLARTQSGSSKI